MHKRIVALAVCCLICAGCSSWPSRGAASSAPLTQDQRAWWEANKQRAIFIPARGYYVEGAGYFDPDGRPLSDLAKSQAPKKPKEDPYEGWLFRRMTGQETPETTAAATPAVSPTTPATIPTPQVPNNRVDPASYAAAGSVAPGQPFSASSSGTMPKSRYAEEYTPEEPPATGMAVFYPSNISKSWLKMMGRNKDIKTAETLYDEGEALFRQAKYAEARDKFKLAARRWTSSALEEDALFLKAECEFFLDDYADANDSYGEMLKSYPNSRHLDKAINRRFAIAHYWQQIHARNPQWIMTPNFFDNERPLFDTGGNALATFDRIRIEDPTGPLADDAIMATANTYFVKGRFNDADYYYDLLRREYPKSEHLLNAYKLGLQAKLQKYQGPAYDGTPLIEAEELIDQMLTVFPQQAPDERDRILLAKQEVRAQRATREWNMAEYYEKGGHNGAAKYYYNVVIKQYPQSNFAQLAQQRVEALKNEPDHPPDRFEMVTRVFGEKKDPQVIATAPTGTIQR